METVTTYLDNGDRYSTVNLLRSLRISLQLLRNRRLGLIPRRRTHAEDVADGTVRDIACACNGLELLDIDHAALGEDVAADVDVAGERGLAGLPGP